jgi:chromosome segregation ATPase|tara:strand:+ start:402 stop:701 length:300 start_codon:yes stop_codon:yes gene_type:complete
MSDVKNVSEKRVIKFSDDELKKIENFKNNLSDIVARLGEVEIELTLLDSQVKTVQSVKDKLKTEYIQLRESEVKLAEELREKYGEGEFDITTGVFTPKK